MGMSRITETSAPELGESGQPPLGCMQEPRSIDFAGGTLSQVGIVVAVVGIAPPCAGAPPCAELPPDDVALLVELDPAPADEPAEFEPLFAAPPELAAPASPSPPRTRSSPPQAAAMVRSNASQPLLLIRVLVIRPRISLNYSRKVVKHAKNPLLICG